MLHVIVVAHQQFDQILLQTVQNVGALLEFSASGHILVLGTTDAVRPDVRIGQQIGKRTLVGRFNVQKYRQTKSRLKVKYSHSDTTLSKITNAS